MKDGKIKLNIFTTDRVKSHLDPSIPFDNHVTEYYRFKAPEILKIESDEIPQFTKESDIFLLGMALYWVYMSCHPFEGGSHVTTLLNIINSPPKEMSEDVPTDSKEIILQMLSKNPEERPTII